MNKKFGFTKPSRGMSTKCESRTRVCRNRAFDSKCERFRLSRGAVASSGTKAAFTLAEVLITLAIVGVVAAITMPALIANIQDRVKTARIQNIKQKFSKATDKMKSLSSLDGYATTMDFVNELQKHLKIAKVCDNQHLTECWPTEKVILDDKGKEWEISKTKTGKQLKMTNDDTHEYGDTVGIVTADGTAMILAYNAKCDLDKTTISWSGEQSSTTGCVAAVFDWNGSKMPNQLSNDVITFNANGLGNGCVVEVDGICFGTMKTYSYITYEECLANKKKWGIDVCTDRYQRDSWGGAVKSCGGLKYLPSKSEIIALGKSVFGCNNKGRECTNLKKAEDLGWNFTWVTDGSGFVDFWARDYHNNIDSAEQDLTSYPNISSAGYRNEGKEVLCLID